MGRNVKPGINFYRMDSGHIVNRKVRLMFNEFDSDGYYIWMCLLDYSYTNNGYYFDYNDKEELELFASDFCKKKVALIKEVIAGCIRRDLFDKSVADSFGILTSEMMQDTFIYATSERRKKGSVFQMVEPWILVNKDKIPGNIEILPGKKSQIPRKNPQTETRQEKTETRQEKSLPVKPAPKKVSTKKVEEPPEPHWDLLVKTWFDFGIEKFSVKPSFDGQDPKIFKRIIQRLKKRAAAKNVEWNGKSGPARLRIFLEMAYSDKWISENFLLSNLEKQFDKVIQNQSAKKLKPVITDIEYLFQRYCEGDLDPKLISINNYFELKEKRLAQISNEIISIRMKSLEGSRIFSDSELLKTYQAGTIPQKDEETLMRIAVVEYFKKEKQKLYAATAS